MRKSDAWLTDKPIVPRKDHICGWCGEKVLKGQSARYRTYIFDGEFQTEYNHPECYDAMSRSDMDCWGYEFGQQYRGKTLDESHQ